MRDIYQFLCHDMVFDGEYRWLWDYSTQVLYRWNVKTNLVKHYGRFKIGRSDAEYGSLLEVDDRLVGIPGLSNQIMIFDKKSENFRYTEVGIQRLLKKDYKLPKFKSGILWREKIYMTGYSPYVLEFDCKTEKVSRYVMLPEQETGGYSSYTSEGILVDGKIFIPACNKPFVYEVDPDTLGIKTHRLDGFGDGFFSGTSVGNGLIYLVPQETESFVEYDPVNGKYEIYQMDKEFQGTKYKRNGSMFYWKDMLWCVTMSSEKLAGFNVVSKKMLMQEAYSEYLKEFNADDRETIHPTMVSQDKEFVYFLMQPGNVFIRLDLESNRIEELEYIYSEEEEKARWYEYNFVYYRMRNEEIITEGDGDLYRFVRGVVGR